MNTPRRYPVEHTRAIPGASTIVPHKPGTSSAKPIGFSSLVPPPSPISSLSSLHSDSDSESLEGEGFHEETNAPEHDITRRAKLWCNALKEKKLAMENLLKAQVVLEDLQDTFVEHLSVEVIEGAHTRFLSGIRPVTSPEARYLLTLGRLTIRPFLSRSLRHDNGRSQTQPHASHIVSPSHAVAQ